MKFNMTIFCVFCPCALVLATTTAIMAAIGQATLEVSDVISFHPTWNDTDLLSLAASAEAKSEHPLGKVIAAYTREKMVCMIGDGVNDAPHTSIKPARKKHL